jgi:hypothetical protein
MKGKVTRLEDEGTRLARQVATSTCMQFVTEAPLTLGKITAGRIGFADIPVVEVISHSNVQDTREIVAVVRQHVFSTLESEGFDTSALAFVPSVGVRQRKKRFTDENPRSRSFGRVKMGYRAAWHFEIDRNRTEEFRSLPRSMNCAQLHSRRHDV